MGPGNQIFDGFQISPRKAALSRGHVPDTPCTIDSSSFAQFPPDATNTTQQGRHAAKMRPVATIMVTIRRYFSLQQIIDTLGESGELAARENELLQRLVGRWQHAVDDVYDTIISEDVSVDERHTVRRHQLTSQSQQHTLMLNDFVYLVYA